MGSPNHTITAYEAAVAASHIALVSLLAIPTGLLSFAHRRNKDTPPRSLWDDSLPTLGLYDRGMETAAEARVAENRGEFVPLKFSAETDRRGRDHVGAMPVLEWKQHEAEGEFLVEKCEGLYETFRKLETGKGGKANGR